MVCNYKPYFSLKLRLAQRTTFGCPELTQEHYKEYLHGQVSAKPPVIKQKEFLITESQYCL